MVMGQNFNGINNLNDQRIGRYYNLADSISGGRDSISRQEAISIFQRHDIALNRQALDNINRDGNAEISRKELAQILAMQDGTLGASGKFEFDGYIEDRSEAGGDLASTIQNEATPEEIDLMCQKFDDYEARLNQPPQNDNPSGGWSMGPGTRYAVYCADAAKATY
jgi:hypothetical protein